MRAHEFEDQTRSGRQVLKYVKSQHHDFHIDHAVLSHPAWELKNIPLSQLKLDPDGEVADPYGRVNWVDYDKVQDLMPKIASVLKRMPIVVDSQGWIIDGNHRAMAAAEAGRDSVPAYVPVKQRMAEGRGAKQEIEEFLDSLSPEDVGVEQFGNYRVHYEGFTDDCKSSGDYRRNPNKVYKQVYQDFIDREGGRKPVKSSMVGDEEYPILYSVFKVPQSKTIDTAEKAYNIAYKKKQPWPRGSREEKLIRSNWQLSGLYDQYVLKQDMAENIQLPGDFKLMGQDLFLKNLARNLKQRYPDATVKRSSDRVVAYYNKEEDDNYFTVMGTEIMDGGYIGIGLDDAFTHSFQGVLVPTIKQTTEQLLAANPGTKPALFLSTDNWNPDAWTHIATKLGYRLVADDEQLDENFADGKVKGKSRPGRVKRAGASCAGSVTSLRAKAKKYGGERGKMYHWCANMKGGRKK